MIQCMQLSQAIDETDQNPTFVCSVLSTEEYTGQALKSTTYSRALTMIMREQLYWSDLPILFEGNVHAGRASHNMSQLCTLLPRLCT